MQSLRQPIVYSREHLPLCFCRPDSEDEQLLWKKSLELASQEYLRIKRNSVDKLNLPSADAMLSNGMTLGEHAMAFIMRKNQKRRVYKKHKHGS